MQVSVRNNKTERELTCDVNIPETIQECIDAYGEDIVPIKGTFKKVEAKQQTRQKDLHTGSLGRTTNSALAMMGETFSIANNEFGISSKTAFDVVPSNRTPDPQPYQGGGGSSININLVVNGTVTTENDLINTITDALGLRLQASIA